MQQMIPSITIAGVKYVNGVARDILRRTSCVTYTGPEEVDRSLERVVVFSDAGYPHSGIEKKIAQEGCIVRISYGKKKNSVVML